MTYMQRTMHKKVRAHFQKSSKYRSPACNICYLNYKDQIFVPVVFHNGKGYDFNLLYDEMFNQNKKK